MWACGWQEVSECAAPPVGQLHEVPNLHRLPLLLDTKQGQRGAQLQAAAGAAWLAVDALALEQEEAEGKSDVLGQLHHHLDTHKCSGVEG